MDQFGKQMYMYTMYSESLLVFYIDQGQILDVLVKILLYDFFNKKCWCTCTHKIFLITKKQSYSLVGFSKTFFVTLQGKGLGRSGYIFHLLEVWI